MTTAGVLHLPDNKSDHCPIYCTFGSTFSQESLSKPNNAKPRPSWKKASSIEKENFRSDLQDKLKQLQVPDSLSNCKNVHCQSPSHKQDLNKYTLELLDLVQNRAETNLPVPASREVQTRARSIRPGWNDEVKPFRDNAYFWHQI